MRLWGICAALMLVAACSAPERLVLPGQVDLKLASGDRIKLCTDDGVEDMTPMSDCVIVERSSHPLTPYADQLKAKGWKLFPGSDAQREVWTGPVCKRLTIDSGRETMSRNRFMILRFEVNVDGCAS